MLVSNLKVEIKGPVSEATVLDNIDRDWGYRRPNRNTKSAVTFRDANNLQYYYPVIVSVDIDGEPNKEMVGKTIGYSGWGSYEDLIVDGGNYVLGWATPEQEKTLTDLGIPNFRGKGVNRLQREPRNDAAKAEALQKNIPLNITLNNNNQSDFYDNQSDFILNSEKQPEWAVQRLKASGKRRWYVYNEKEPPMQKAWKILKGW